MSKLTRNIICGFLAAFLLAGMMPTAVLGAEMVADPLDPAARAALEEQQVVIEGDGVTYIHSGCSPLDAEDCDLCQTQSAEDIGATAFGIDVSRWQGVIDWETVAPQIDFAIIRCGYGENLTNQDDLYWYDNVQACTELGIPFGVYLYSYATTDAKALSEAQHVLRLLEGYEPTLPVYLDLEDQSILDNCTNEEILRHAQIFCDAIEEAGYRAGIYSNLWWWTTFLTDDAYDQWDRWLAQYASAPGLEKDFSVWQYSCEGAIDGIDGNVDLNYWFGEFPPHYHRYTESTVAPGCATEGAWVYTCECGDSYSVPIPATGHDFLDGYCTVCGKLDGDYPFVPAAVTVAAASAHPGDAVTVAVSLADNPGFANFDLTVGYDPAVMTLTGIAPGDLLAESETGVLTVEGDTAVWADTVSTTENGALLTLTFDLAADAAEGVYPVSIALTEEDPMGFADALGRQVPVTFTAGGVELTHYDPVVAAGTSGDLTWTLMDDGVLTFSGTGAMADYAARTEMPWFDYADRISAVVLEAGATSIGDYAFYGLPITTVEIPETVATIGGYAFKSCAALDGVTLPAGLTRLGESAFYGCTSLTAIEIPASLWTVQPYTFKNCTALARVTLHEGNLMKLSDGAFYGTALTEITIPGCVDIIDVYCFKNCAALASVTLTEGDLTQIREASFYGTAISGITIPEGVTVIKPYAFKNCANLTSVSLPRSLTEVGEASFYACAALESVVLPDAVTAVGNYAFRKCGALESVTFGEGLTTIGESSFYGCTGLTALVIPENVTAIGAYAFKGCTGVTEVTLPDALVTIGASAFHTCTGLKTLVIPANVDTVGEYCFAGSWNLYQLTFLGDAPVIGANAFRGLAARVCYPAGNTTWTADVMGSYGGTITWRAVDPA